MTHLNLIVLVPFRIVSCSMLVVDGGVVYIDTFIRIVKTTLRHGPCQGPEARKNKYLLNLIVL